MCDEFVKQFLGAPDTREVLEWLGSTPDSEYRSLGESGSTEDAIALAQKIYDAGAVEVLAVEIDEYEGVGQNSGRLVIKLPDQPEARRRVFAWAAANSESHGFDPYTDTGQRYLFSMLD
jgi:hypothetical protein